MIPETRALCHCTGMANGVGLREICPRPRLGGTVNDMQTAASEGGDVYTTSVFTVQPFFLVQTRRSPQAGCLRATNNRHSHVALERLYL